MSVSTNRHVVWQSLQLDRMQRAASKGQQPFVLWFTGLSGAGKSTLANRLEARLLALGYHSFLLDGDNVRHGLSQDLGFSAKDREENIRRVAEVARLMLEAGLIVLTALISPTRQDRARAREIVGPEAFIEVFVDTPLVECQRRDPKGLYRKVQAGLISGFTGIDAVYEPPHHPDIHIRTEASVETVVESLMDQLMARGLLLDRQL